ncbi:phytanoyl-CoA dioxygenase family protein [Elongatibacter sediminis]|uniref:Phytanoyl-CoA dioxygenase family protein n=1 Tax=Elongatibacter sediminis TaxID=3119006 RepID=A0AAW9RA60_9GAMM
MTAPIDTANGLAERFNDRGYLVFDSALPATAIAGIREAAARIVSEFDIEQHRSVFSTGDRDRGRDRYFMESAEAVHCFLEEDALDANGNLTCPRERAINKIGHALHDLVPEFGTFCRLPVFGDILRALGMSEPRLWQTMYIFKQPRIGGEVRWHQDASYLATRPPAVVGFWVAVEDAHRDNGCLWVQPGGHRGPLREIYEVDRTTLAGELRTLSDQAWPGPDEAVALEVPAGSIIVFSDLMPHYSSRNRSNRSRQAFTLHFAPATAHWSEANWLQRPTLPPFEPG